MSLPQNIALIVTHPPCLLTSLLPDFYWRIKGKELLVILFQLQKLLSDFDFRHICMDKALEESSWLKPMTVFLKAYPALKLISEWKFILIFLFPKSPLHYSKEASSYLFPGSFPFSFPCTIDSCLLPTCNPGALIESCVRGLRTCKLCFFIYQVLKINPSWKCKTNGFVHFCQGWGYFVIFYSLPIWNPITKLT